MRRLNNKMKTGSKYLNCSEKTKQKIPKNIKTQIQLQQKQNSLRFTLASLVLIWSLCVTVFANFNNQSIILCFLVVSTWK